MQPISNYLARNAELYPGKPALVDIASGRTRTWGEAHRESVVFAKSLLDDHKLERGDRVAILSLNSDVYFELLFAVPYAGGVVVPLNFRLSPEELNHIIADSGAKILVVDDVHEKTVLPKLQLAGVKSVIKVETLLALSGASKGKASDVALPRHVVKPAEDVYGIFYTSGTTSKAKGVMLTHANVFVNSLGSLYLNNFHPTTRFLHVAPMFHLADCQMVFAATLAASVHVFAQRFVPGELLPLMDTHQIDKLVLIPVMIQMVLALPDLKIPESLKARSIEFCYGGSVMSESTMMLLQSKLPKATLFAGFGMTETSPGISYLPNVEHKPGSKKINSVGTPMPWIEVRIVDPETGVVIKERNVFGEIQCRGNNMKGYWNLPEATAAALIEGGWMRTGDGGHIDEDGYLFLGDRIKDMIKTGGENVFSAEVERCLMGMVDKVAMVAVVGEKEPTFGEIVVAVIVPKVKGTTITVEEVKAFCNGKLAGYKMPKKVLMREALPISGAGKILKKELREELAKEKANSAKSG